MAGRSARRLCQTAFPYLSQLPQRGAKVRFAEVLHEGLLVAALVMVTIFANS